MFGMGRKQSDRQQPMSQAMRTMEDVPSQAYYIGAVASLLLSAVLFLSGKRTAAIFVGQWPPTFILLSLFYKLLRPSQEGMGRGTRRAAQRAKMS